ncbi:MAG: LysR family transcriptional regulator [Paracoccaceae bacterium]
MHSKENWDDLRYVLAVAEQGSVSAASRVLGVNHATVLRRIAAFEERHGVELFNKSARGYAISEDRIRVIDAAREVENAVLAVDRIIQGAQAPLRGVVRVTSTDTFCGAVLPAMLARWQGQEGELRIELLSTNAHLDLSRLHADIAVRPTLQLADDLAGELAAKLAFDIYARPGADTEKWLGLSGSLARSMVAGWLADRAGAEAITGAADSFVTLREMAAAGMGQAILPCILGDADARLERRRGVLPDMAVDIWVASHFDLADVPRIRAVRRLLVEGLASIADRLEGRVS